MTFPPERSAESVSLTEISVSSCCAAALTVFSQKAASLRLLITGDALPLLTWFEIVKLTKSAHHVTKPLMLTLNLVMPVRAETEKVLTSVPSRGHERFSVTVEPPVLVPTTSNVIAPPLEPL